MNRPSYKELWSDEYKDRDEQLQWIRNAVSGNAKFCNSEPPYSEEEELARKIMKMHARIAELEAERRWKDSNVELPKEDTDGNTLMVIHRYSGEWAKAPFGIEFSDEFVRHYSYWMYAPEMPEVQE